MDNNTIPDANASQWELEQFIEKLIDNNCKNIPYEGTEINKQELKEGILELLNGHNTAVLKDHLINTLDEVNKQIDIHTKSNCDDHTPYYGACVSCGRMDNFQLITDIDELKESISNIGIETKPQ